MARMGSGLVSWLLFWSVFVSPSWSQQGDEINWDQSRELYPGILYQRLDLEQPRLMVVHVVRVDTTTPGLKFHTTERIDAWESGKRETRRQTARNFIRTAREAGKPVVVAINADAFSPWPAPYSREDPADLLGLAISDQVMISEAQGGPSLIVGDDGKLKIAAVRVGDDLSAIQDAVSGFGLCLENGQVLPGDDSLHPRTGLGLSTEGRYLFLMTIDGRQPASAGATTSDLGTLLKQAGAMTAINMDGGGSTTLAWWDPTADTDQECQVLNSPVGNGQSVEPKDAASFRPTERANGNHFGVYFEPSPGEVRDSP